VLGLLVFFVLVAAGPLSGVHLSRIDAFVPAYATALFVNDTITAILLYPQFSILRSRAILVIASGYLFTALILIPWILVFPGVFAPTSLMVACKARHGSTFSSTLRSSRFAAALRPGLIACSAYRHNLFRLPDLR
jgi:hypothetical protein